MDHSWSGRARAPRRGLQLLGRARASAAFFAMALIATGTPMFVAVLPAAAATTTYSKTFTVPAPPASGFAGASAGGDGWSVALSTTQVFNVFHHDPAVRVNCHNQADASDCWPSGPKTVTDGQGGNFSTSAQPGLYLDPVSGHLFVPGIRSTDNTGGVVCIDTTQPADATGDQLFCGFTALTATGGATYGYYDESNPVQIGPKWFIYDEAQTGTTDNGKMLCFDLSTFAACGGQPFAVSGTVPSADAGYGIAGIAGRIYLQGHTPALGESVMGCFDPTNGTCAGSWPVAIPLGIGSGAPVPLLDGTGVANGVCTRATECFNFDGTVVATPPNGLSSVLSGSSQWNGPGVVLGTRLYVPSTETSSVGCYDFALGAGCANFPKAYDGISLYYLYTVNADPQRPTCLWVNADSGSAQIQTFDAYTGGPCGGGPIRVLSSSVVVNDPSCTPSSYTSLQVLQPAPGGYSSGAVDFEDGSGNPIPGVATHPLDNTGTADLTDLNLSTITPLPQFLITLNNPTSAISDVQLKLTWSGTYSDTCLQNGVTALPPTDLPEAPLAVLMPASLGAVAVAAVAVRRSRRARRAPAV